MAEHEFYGAVKQSDVDDLAAALSAKANDSEVVKNTGAQELSNSFTFNSPVGVAQGTVAYHAVRRDDNRFVPSGGAAGQILRKTSGSNHAMAWGDAMGGVVDCSAMTTASAVSAAASAAGPGYTVWLGARNTPLVLEDTLVIQPGQKLLGAGGRTMLTRIAAGPNFPAGKPMVASAGWINNQDHADNPICVTGVHFDANSRAGVNGLTVYNFWSHFEDLQFVDFAADTRQINVTDRTFNNTVSTNSHSENTFVRCRFDQTAGIHFYAESTNGISNQDGHILDCFMVGCSGYSVRITRAAGWSIENCHFYGIGSTAISLSNCYATKVLRNYIEDFGTSQVTDPPTYGYYSGIEFSTVLDSRASIIANNTVSIIQPDNTPANRFVGISARAGSEQTNAHLVLDSNIVVMAPNVIHTGSNKSFAYRFGEGEDEPNPNRMLYVTASGNAHDYNRSSWYAAVDEIFPNTVRLVKDGVTQVRRNIDTNLILNPPNGPTRVRWELRAVGGARTVTVPSEVRLSTGLEERTFNVPSGAVFFGLYEWSSLANAHILSAATVSS